MCNSDDFFPSSARYVRKFHSSACQVKILDYADFLLPIVFDKSVLKLHFVNVERVHTFIEHVKKSLPIVFAYISSGSKRRNKDMAPLEYFSTGYYTHSVNLITRTITL